MPYEVIRRNNNIVVDFAEIINGIRTLRDPNPQWREDKREYDGNLPSNIKKQTTIIDNSGVITEVVTEPTEFIESMDEMIVVLERWREQQKEWRNDLSLYGGTIQAKGVAFLDLGYNATRLIYEGLPISIPDFGSVSETAITYTAPNASPFIQRVRIDPDEDQVEIFVRQDINTLSKIQINNTEYDVNNGGDFTQPTIQINGITTYRYFIDTTDFLNADNTSMWIRFKYSDDTYYDILADNIELKRKMIISATQGAADINSVETFVENVDLLDPSIFPFYDSATNTFSQVILWVDRETGDQTNLLNSPIYGYNPNTPFYDVFWE